MSGTESRGNNFLESNNTLQGLRNTGVTSFCLLTWTFWWTCKFYDQLVWSQVPIARCTSILPLSSKEGQTEDSLIFLPWKPPFCFTRYNTHLFLTELVLFPFANLFCNIIRLYLLSFYPCLWLLGLHLPESSLSLLFLAGLKEPLNMCYKTLIQCFVEIKCCFISS